MNQNVVYRPNNARRGNVTTPIVTILPNNGKNKAKKTKKNISNGGTGLNSFKFLDNYFNYVKSAILNSNFLIFFCFALFLIIGYTNSKDNIITVFVKKLIDNENTLALGIWLETYIIRIIGFIAFVPGILAVKDSKRFTIFILVLLWVLIVPEYYPYEYLVQGVLVYLILKTESDKNRLISATILVLCYISQFGFDTTKALHCKMFYSNYSCIKSHCVWKVDTCTDVKVIPSNANSG